MNHDERRKIALWRYSILGPLVSARLEYGDRREHFLHAAQRLYDHPLGEKKVRVSPRTIEDWYYAYLARGVEGLEPQSRSDAKQSRALSADIEALLVRAKRQRPRRSVRQLIRILVRAGKVAPNELSTATVYRALRRAGLPTHRPRAHTHKERRAFLPEHAGDLWVGDVMHTPRVRRDGRMRKTYLISIIDAATRYLVGSSFRLGETAIDHEAVLKQTLRVHGRPRTYYVDRGAAYVSGSLRAICADLGIHLTLTEPRDAEAKGSIERWHRTWRAEVGIELEGEIFDFDQLQAVHAAWLAREYHARQHGTTGRPPREHFLAEVAAGHVRPLPRGIDLDAVFWHRAQRTVRKDNTVSIGGRRLELVLAGMAGRKVELRFDPTDDESAPKVYVDGVFVCDTRKLDLHANARRKRKRVEEAPAEAPLSRTELDPLGDLLAEHYGTDFDPSTDEEADQ
jgi:putative transposase